MRPVALLYVEVDDQHAPQTPLRFEHTECDDDVVEDAEAVAGTREGMVGAATEVGGSPALERDARRCERHACRTAGSLDELR